MPVILCADDYALTEGVSAAIDELAIASRLSATSALVTGRHWPRLAPRLAATRERIAAGLHLNLTLGSPLGPMPRLGPSGSLPPLRTLVCMALIGRLDLAEIAAETIRQLDRFESEYGHPPDFVDGHQHVHALPGVRSAVLEALTARYPSDKPLVRDPADLVSSILGRGTALPKALTIAGLAAGFGARARALGFPTNRGFSGVSRFDDSIPYGTELALFLSHPGPAHLVMCHPGYPDAELARLDPVVERRKSELDALSGWPDLPDLIWHPVRDQAGRILWPAETDIDA